MTERHVLTSVARIADLDSAAYDVAALPRSQWGEADYVAARVVGTPSRRYGLELCSGRMLEPMEGTGVIGALGTRAATLEAVGSWSDVGDDGEMHLLTGAGLLGKSTSAAHWISPLTRLVYVGHVQRAGRKLSMGDFVAPVPPAGLDVPVVLLVGTSMSAGKTTMGRTLIRELKDAGLRVLGAKLTGASRYRDVLSFLDAGADDILDFVDAGLPSTIVPRARFDAAMQYMISRIMSAGPDVVVAEAGASPLEPYNGAAAVAALGGHVRCSVLCASDPYAVLGVRTAFGFEPSLVAGPAANTRAGIDLVAELTGLEAVNVFEPSSRVRLRAMLETALPELL